jgi:hypothetical protein
VAGHGIAAGGQRDAIRRARKASEPVAESLPIEQRGSRANLDLIVPRQGVALVMIE